MSGISSGNLMGTVYKTSWVDKVCRIKSFGAAIALIPSSILLKVKISCTRLRTDMTNIVSTMWAGTFDEPIRQEPGGVSHTTDNL
jgi:hypothetical protein